MRSFSLLLVCLTSFLGGCGSDDLPKTQDLASLRVLALTADLPEIGPGETATITPLLSDVSGIGRPLQYSVETCEDPGIPTGASVSCEGSSSRTTGSSGTAATLTAANAFTADGTSFSVTAPSSFLSSKSAIERYNGAALLVLYRVSASSFGGLPAESILSFRRILVTDRASALRNKNPVLSKVIQNGGSFEAVPPTGKTEVVAEYSSSSTESYSLYDTSGALKSAKEEILTSYFITDGELDFPRATSRPVTWTPPEAWPGQRAKALVTVGRDGRGGEVHLITRFN